MKTTIINNICKTTGNPATYNIAIDEIGLDPNIPYSDEGAEISFNFNYQTMPLVIPVFERGEIEEGLTHKCSFNGSRSVRVVLYDTSLNVTDGNFNNSSLIIFQP